jgi:CRP-like cAMP-binding protein
VETGMTSQKILRNVAKHIHLNKKEIDYFMSILSPGHAPRHTRILTEGQACRFIYYVERGVFRSFCTDKKGSESTVMFAIDDWWITDMHSFILEKPAITTIEAIEDSEVWRLAKEDLDRLYIKVPKFEKFFRIMMQNSYIREQVRMSQRLTDDAGRRYQNFIARYPHFIQRIPLKLIASYLGVTPQFLSVLRKRK